MGWQVCLWLGAGKVAWDEQKVKDLASDMVSALPLTALQLVQSGEWKGGGIIRLDSELATPSAADVAANVHLMKPVLKCSPDRVPKQQREC